MEIRVGAPSSNSIDVPLSFQDAKHHKATTRAIMESFALPRCSVKKNILAAQAEFETNYCSSYYLAA